MKGTGMKALCCALGIVLASAAAAAGPDELRTQTHTLPNGLRLVLAPDAGAAGVHVAAWYRVGTRDERPGHTGLAALMEQLTTRGAGEQRVRRVQSVGGNFSAFTGPDYTCYQQTIPREQLEVALQAEAGRMAGLTLAGSDLVVPRAAVAARTRQRATAPFTLGLDRLYQVAFSRHPYGYAATVALEDLEGVTTEECRTFFQDYYAPANAVITVTGDFDPAEALRLARKHFTAPRRAAAARSRAPEPAQTAERRAEERLPAAALLLFVGWKAPPDSSSDAAALELLSRLLAVGAGSRLSQRLVTPGELAWQVHGEFDGRAEPGLFYVAVALKSEDAREEVERIVVEVVEGAGTAPPTAEEMERCRNLTEAGVLVNWQAVQNRAQWIGRGAVRFGRPDALRDRLALQRRAGAGDLQRAAQSWLRPEGRSVVWVLPEAGPGQGVR
jgi:predicted Zn-dependent peptidase